MRWGHSLWFSFFICDETTQNIRVQTFSGAIRIRTAGLNEILRHRDKLSGAQCSHFFTNAFCSIFGSQQQLNGFLSVFSWSPPESNSCSIQLTLSLVELLMNAAWSNQISVTHVFSIRIFFSRRVESSRVDAAEECLKNKEATRDGDNWHNRTDPFRNSFGWFIHATDSNLERVGAFPEQSLHEWAIGKSFGENFFRWVFHAMWGGRENCFLMFF